MRKLVALSVLCLVGLSGCSQSAKVTYPPTAFDAVYERASSKRTLAYRQLSDGEGHVRVYMELPPKPHAKKPTHETEQVLMDYTKRQVFLLSPKRKLAYPRPMSPEQNGAPYDDERIKAKNGTALGTKVIDGHPCHGWQYSIRNTVNEVWYGDDTGCLVSAIHKHSNGGESTMRLKEYKPGKPDPALFSIPPDFKVADISTPAPVRGL